jgi:hypothetical protein
MKFVTVKNETSLADLTREVFEIKGAKAATAAKSAHAALREANPHIADLKKLPAGTLVVVPDLPGIKATPAQSPGGASPELVRHLKRVLSGAKAVVEKSAAAQSEDAEASVSLAKDHELAALARKTPELKDRLSQIVEQAKTQSKQVAEDKKSQIQGLAQLEKDLATLSPE